MRKRDFLIPVFLTIMVCWGGAVAWAGGSAKVQICHIPPGNPSNFHTITVSENALPAHLAHGDIAGGCFDNCETLCDDGDACTVDACDPATGQCATEHPPVDCDDGLLCTQDSCDSAAGGCVYAEIDCSDGDLCTIDFCDPIDGLCGNQPIACEFGCDPATGTCNVDPCDGVICTPVDQCHVAGVCTAGVCDDPIAPDGTACDDGDPATVDDECVSGSCVGTIPSCLSNADCDDGNPCTIDICDPEQGCVCDPICEGTETSCGCTVCEDCSALDGWYNLGGTYACCDGNSVCATCQNQEFQAWVCGGVQCSYSVTGTRMLKEDCTSCSDGETCIDGACN